MRTSKVGDDFIDDLALAGHEGTVADRMQGTAADGRCRTKTGTLTGVSNLSGYCFNGDGKTMIFSILMGGVRDLDARPRRTGPDRGGDRRLLSPATPREQSQQAAFVEDLDPEALRLGQLRAGALAGDDVVGFLRDRAGHLAARGLDPGARPRRG